MVAVEDVNRRNSGGEPLKRNGYMETRIPYPSAQLDFALLHQAIDSTSARAARHSASAAKGRHHAARR